ncbi:hypothetical protein A3Q56_06866 [Intoshia linei]|uniref:Transmembrane protein family 132 fourth domain-containing protein n=1 Tax=Intoshia linei TaxID=1819745 RepID=A0A177ATW0_9BILA|nr:hypothetical protein A3Q56_06866 [Intoshia linei]
MNLPKFINTFNYNLKNGLILEKIEHPSFLEMSNFKLYNKDYSFLKCSFVNEFYFSDSHKNLHLCYNIFNSKLKDVRDTTNMNIHNFLHFNDSGITFNFILENESRFLSFNSYSFNLKISVPIIKITNLNLYAMNRYKEKNEHKPQSLMRYVHFQKNFDRSYKNYSNINNSNYVTLIEHGVTRNNNTFIKDNVKIHINVANHVINREKPVLNVIFTLMEVKNVFYFDVKQRNSHKKGLWCAFIYAENINENLVSNCILEYVFSNNTVYFGGASCLTSLNIPTSWWKNSQSQSNYVAKTFKLFYSIQYHVIENECLKPNFGKRFFLSIISLSNEYSFYNQIENAKFIIQMPQNSFKPTQKVYTILKYTDKLSNFKDTRLIIKSQEGVKIEMIENKNPSIWDINFKIYNKKLAAVVDISLKENYDSYTSKNLKTISEIILRVDKKDNYTEKSNNNYFKIVSVLFKTINLEPKEKKLIEVRVKNHSFKVLKDSAFKKNTDLKKDDPNVFTAHIKINHDSITNIIPIVNVVIYAIDDNNRIFNIKNDYCKCYSTNEDALKVVKSCSNVYVDGTEKHGSSLVTIILRCKNITKLIVFKVWFPLIPLSIHLSDPYLSKIIDKSESNGTIKGVLAVVRRPKKRQDLQGYFF